MFRRNAATIIATTATALASRRTVVHTFVGPTLEQELAKGAPTVVDCYAEWCGPCMAYAPSYEKHSDDPKFKNVRFVKINVDDFEEVAAQLNIRSVPTFIFFDKTGKLSTMVEGASDARIVKALTTLTE